MPILSVKRGIILVDLRTCKTLAMQSMCIIIALLFVISGSVHVLAFRPQAQPPSEAQSPSSPPPLSSPSPTAIQRQEGEQQGIIEGVTANGIIDSLIFTPFSTWIATGNWTVGVNNGALALVSANMTWISQIDQMC